MTHPNHSIDAYWLRFGGLRAGGPPPPPALGLGGTTLAKGEANGFALVVG